MKKLLGKLVILFAVFALVACGSGNGNDNDDEAEWNNSSLYLITDIGTIDDKSFNQGSFEGLKKFAEEIGVEAQYVKPTEQSNQAYLAAIGQAVNAGAKIVVTPGYLFENAIFEAQTLYPDVKFILVDGEPRPEGENMPAEYKDNAVGLLFAEEQSGFLAGYAAVMDGNTNLGFMGGLAVPAVVRFGYGYVAGADYAAAELGVQINIRYTYINSFVADPSIQTQAAAWYNDGVEVIFSAAGGAGNSVMAAAEANDGKWVIGVDVDQKEESASVLTSAMKNLQLAVYTQAKSIYDGTFDGGKTHLLTIEEEMVQISSDFSRFTTFTEDDYNAIVDALKADTDGIRSNIPTNDTVDSASAITVTNSTIQVIE